MFTYKSPINVIVSTQYIVNIIHDLNVIFNRSILAYGCYLFDVFFVSYNIFILIRRKSRKD